MINDNFLRYCHAFTGVLQRQQNDSLCSNCKAFTNSLNNLLDAIAEFEKSNADNITTQQSSALQTIKNELSLLSAPKNAPGQKKQGNCKMPQGVCFIKTPKKIIESL